MLSFCLNNNVRELKSEFLIVFSASQPLIHTCGTALASSPLCSWSPRLWIPILQGCPLPADLCSVSSDMPFHTSPSYPVRLGIAQPLQTRHLDPLRRFIPCELRPSDMLSSKCCRVSDLSVHVAAAWWKGTPRAAPRRRLRQAARTAPTPSARPCRPSTCRWRGALSLLNSDLRDKTSAFTCSGMV